MARLVASGCVALVLLLAGCLGTSSSPEPVAPGAVSAAGPAATPAAPDLIEAPFAWSGRIATGAMACVHAATMTCQGASLGPGEVEQYPALDGSLVGASLTATWSATSPLTERLDFGIMTMRGDGMEPGDDFAMVSGTSPLALDARDFRVDDGERVHLFVYVPSTTPNPAPVWVTQDQPFEVAGILVVAR